jgi:tetratricopeptide (TPR) repeat protein
MQKTRRFFLLITFINFILISISSSQNIEIIPDIPDNAIGPMDKLVDKGIQKGLELVYQEQYEKSLAVFDSIQKALPQHPAPYFYKAAILQTWMATYRFNKFLNEVEQNVEKVIQLCDKSLEKNPDDPWTYFYLGGAYGYRAFAKMRGYNWIGAYLDGMKGLDNLKITLNKDPRMYDVYLGLGSYHYWRTARSKFIRIFAFWWSDERDLGVKQYRFSMKHGKYSQMESAVTLLTVYFDYNRYNDMIPLLKEIENNKSINSISVKYMHGRLAAEQKKWPETLKIFTGIYKKLKNYRYQSIGYQVECQYWMALAYHKLGKDKEANNEIALALAANLTRDSSIEMESTFESYDQIIKRIEELEDELKHSDTAIDQLKSPQSTSNTLGDLNK